MIGQMSGVNPETLLAWAVFFSTYIILIISHAISRLNLLCLIIAFSSFYLASKLLFMIPIAGIMFALLGLFYIMFFFAKALKK